MTLVRQRAVIKAIYALLPIVDVFGEPFNPLRWAPRPGKVQGPFPSANMLAWLRAGYLDENTRVTDDMVRFYRFYAPLLARNY